MKKLLLILAAISVSCITVAQTITKNYVKSTSYNQPVKTQAEINALPDYNKNESITYYDGLGRPEQTIIRRAGGQTNSSESNILPMDWTLNATTTPFYNRNGQEDDNKIIEGATPFVTSDLLWRCGNDAARDADGGWNTDYIAVDNTKKYRYTTWVKRDGSTTNGYTYHGTKNVDNLDGTANSNPYFFSGYLPQTYTWYLMVGVIHPHTYTGGDSGEGGIYTMGGSKVADAKEFKWGANTTVSLFRNYLYYSTDTNVRQYFWNPLLQQVNNYTPTVIDLIASDFVRQGRGGVPKDIVTPIEYDSFGRQVIDHLPYADFTLENFIPTNTAIARQKNYYLDTYADDLTPNLPNPFSEKVLEASPLNRILEQGAPGKDWRANKTSNTDHTIKFGYQTNSTTDRVRQFEVHFPAPSTTEQELPKLRLTPNRPFYASKQLYKTVTKDENWIPFISGKNHTTEEFKNRQGQVILKRTYNNNVPHDTYYIYDDFENLTYVLSPEGADNIIESGSSISQTVLDELCYQYRYDKRNRLVEKKIPGKGWEYIIYNKLDQPVMTQDAVQRSQPTKEWLVIKYDAFERVAYTGLYEHNGTRVSLQNKVNTQYNNAIPNKLVYEVRTTRATALSNDPTTVLHYSNHTFPQHIDKIYTINYYDDYDWDTGAQQNGQTFSNKTKTLATGSKVRTLDTNDWTTTVNYYDEKARPVFTATNNTFLETTDATQTQLDFSGKVIKTNTVHFKGPEAVAEKIITQDNYTYDQAGRLLTHEQQIDDFDKQLIAKNSYDQLGQLVKKQVGGKLPKLSTYTKLTNVAVTNNTITKIASGTYGWNAGLSTIQRFAGDGYVSFSPIQNNTHIFVGLSYTDADANYNSINYAIHGHANGHIRIYERGENKGQKVAYNANDILKIERRGQQVHYLKNGEVFYTSLTPSSAGTMIGDISLHAPGNFGIKDFVLVDLEKELQEVDYDYNIRGWLKNINDVDTMNNDLFSFKLNYNKEEGTVRLGALYNGNISQSLWRTANIDKTKRGYSYQYDPLNRIKKGTMLKGDNFNIFAKHHLRTVNYDKNGNITTLKRDNAVATIDDLSYTYSGNRLTQVDDAITGFQNEGFNEKSSGKRDYVYDVNGNMTQDANKGITSITYNHLNLPTTVTINNGNIQYTYDAIGTKLLKKVTINGIASPIIEETVYAGNYVYSSKASEFNGDFALKFIKHSEGYIEPTLEQDTNGLVVETIDYIYQYKDHIGNIRLAYSDLDGNGSINPETEILKENNYYPFGLQHKGYNNVVTATNIAQNYKYNGKELNESLDLNWYDYGKRRYDPAIGRWFVNDRLADDENQIDKSPYAYSWNSPISLKDPDGDCPWCIGGLVGIITDYGLQVTSNIVEGKSLGDALTDIDGKATLAAAASGAAGVGIFDKISKARKVIKTAQTAKRVAKAKKLQERAKKLNKVSRSGKDFTKAGKDVVKQQNKLKNGGKMKCEGCGKKLKNAKQHKKGKTPPKNEAHVDHKIPKSKGGSGTPNNGQVLCRGCNLEKGNKIINN